MGCLGPSGWPSWVSELPWAPHPSQGCLLVPPTHPALSAHPWGPSRVALGTPLFFHTSTGPLHAGWTAEPSGLLQLCRALLGGRTQELWPPKHDPCAHVWLRLGGGLPCCTVPHGPVEVGGGGSMHAARRRSILPGGFQRPSQASSGGKDRARSCSPTGGPGKPMLARRPRCDAPEQLSLTPRYLQSGESLCTPHPTLLPVCSPSFWEPGVSVRWAFAGACQAQSGAPHHEVARKAPRACCGPRSASHAAQEEPEPGACGPQLPAGPPGGYGALNSTHPGAQNHSGWPEPGHLPRRGCEASVGVPWTTAAHS
ncbi:uncharacterized protein LOC124244892 [Equus quagga]|uniref:uncharacterized protein LOC124244892 n=1 Tax=Equus quagga TaxID=89248 RepID=UPI001EE272C3|nr:uncharacterized protein LOC124244892 [Equus quagga]